MLYRIKRFVVDVISSVIATISYQIKSFVDHYNGPRVLWAIEDFNQWLKWEGKADNMLDPYDVRQKLAEYLHDRGINT